MNQRATEAKGQGRLGFTESAQSTFAFLTEFGLNVVRTEATLVRLESAEVFVQVFHGRSSYQVGLELGRVGRGEWYSLYEVLSALAPAMVERARCQTREADVLRTCLESIAQVLRTSCQPLLAGDDDAFAELDSVASRMRRTATLDAQFGPVIERADRAWEARGLGHRCRAVLSSGGSTRKLTAKAS